MPYADSCGVRISYEVTGQGPAVILIHGATSSLDVWKEDPSVVNRLADAYTVILYDARGHGRSDRPHVPEAYDIQLMASDALAVLDAVGMERAHVWGYSMGGWTAIQLAREAPQRLRSLILGGTGPTSGPQPPDSPPGPLLRAMRQGVESGPDVVVQAVREAYGELPAGYEGRLRSQDYQAMAALLEYNNYHAIDQFDILPTIAVPCLVYMSEADDPGFVETRAWVSQIPDATFVAIGGTHIDGDPEAEVSNARQFLDRVEAQKQARR
jgi:pimeloyl-ACP methyl ester carboxylesterase